MKRVVAYLFVREVKASVGFALTHELFLLDANLKKKLNNKKKRVITEKLVDDLLKHLDMKPLAPLQIYPASDPRAPGWSFVQLITTSHIYGHYFESITPHIHVDIYSCKSFRWENALNIIHKHLNLDAWKANFILRSVNLEDRNIFEKSGKGKKIF